MAVKPASTPTRSLSPPLRTRAAMAKRLAAQAGRMSTAVAAELEA